MDFKTLQKLLDQIKEKLKEVTVGKNPKFKIPTEPTFWEYKVEYDDKYKCYFQIIGISIDYKIRSDCYYLYDEYEHPSEDLRHAVSRAADEAKDELPCLLTNLAVDKYVMPDDGDLAVDIVEEPCEHASDCEIEYNEWDAKYNNRPYYEDDTGYSEPVGTILDGDTTIWINNSMSLELRFITTKDYDFSKIKSINSSVK